MYYNDNTGLRWSRNSWLYNLKTDFFLRNMYLHGDIFDNKPKQNIPYSYNSKASLLKRKQTKSHFKKQIIPRLRNSPVRRKAIIGYWIIPGNCTWCPSLTHFNYSLTLIPLVQPWHSLSLSGGVCRVAHA